jgi:predicted Zn-dependent protease
MSSLVPQAASADASIDLLTLFEEVARSPSRPPTDRGALEALYGLASSSLLHRRFEEAHRLFSLLIGLDPSQARFLDGLGQSASGMGQHAEALAFHSLALKVEPANVALMLPVAQAMLALGHRSLARDVLSLIQACCQSDASQATTAARVQVLLELTQDGH